MNYLELYQSIQDYAENTESTFVTSIPTFVKEAEARIYNSVQIPALRKNVTGVLTANNKYLACPNDFLSTYSLAVIDGTGNYEYLLNKDVNFLRASYPNPNVLGFPKYYSLFGTRTSNSNELSFILGPTPDSGYSAELHYFYYPVSIVQGVISAFGAVTGGSSYNNGTYYNVPLNGGYGNGALANITVTSGAVSSVSITDGGSLYVIGDVLTVSNTNIGGSGSGFSIPVLTTNNPSGTSWLGDNYDPCLLYTSPSPRDS